MSRTMWYDGVRITADRGGGGGGLLIGLAALAVVILALAAVISAANEAVAVAAGALRPWLTPTAVAGAVGLPTALVLRRVLERHRVRVFRRHGRDVALERAERGATRNLTASGPASLPEPVRGTCERLDQVPGPAAGHTEGVSRGGCVR